MEIKKFFIIFALISLITLAACSNQGTVQGTKKEPVVIGATLALSGNLAYIGEQEDKGIHLAIDEINQAGGINGRPFKVIIEDNQSDAKKAVDSVNKLVSINKADILLSAFTHVTEAIKNIAFSNQKILFYQSTVRNIAEENKYSFRDYFDSAEHGQFLAEMVAKQGYQRVSTISESSAVCHTFEDAFSERATSFGLNVKKIENFQKEDKDLKTSISKLEPNNIEAIVACTWGHNHIFMKNLNELNLIDKPVFQLVAPFLPSGDTPELRKLYEDNQTISTWYGFTNDTNNPKYIEFKEKFMAKYGTEPTADAVYFYDDMFILRDALKTCDDRGLIDDNNCIAEELLKTDYDGAGGHLSFDKNGVSTREVFGIQVKDGEWVQVK